MLVRIRGILYKTYANTTAQYNNTQVSLFCCLFVVIESIGAVCHASLFMLFTKTQELFPPSLSTLGHRADLWEMWFQDSCAGAALPDHPHQLKTTLPTTLPVDSQFFRVNE